MEKVIGIIIRQLNLQPEVRGGEFWFSKIDLENVRQSFEKNNIAVIGIEGARLVGQLTHPDPDLIADFSEVKSSDWAEFKRESNRGANAFLQKTPEDPDLKFSITVYSEEEWRRDREKFSR